MEPRWWRFSRRGIPPIDVMSIIDQVNAGALILAADGAPVGMAALAEGQGASGTGQLDVFALPNDAAEATVAAVVPEIITAAFEGAPIRRLYHERFDDDPMLLGATLPAWEHEARFPEFARVGGRLVDRSSWALSRERFDAWRTAEAAE